MPELLVECFSEEIPARFQARGAEDLCRLLTEALAPLAPKTLNSFFGPRRIAFAAEISAEVAASSVLERGPRVTAPEQALSGFLRKHGATREALRQEGDFWVLEKASAAQDAASLIAAVMPGLLRRFPVAEIHAVGRHQCVYLGAAAAADSVPAGRRGGAVQSGNT